MTAVTRRAVLTGLAATGIGATGLAASDQANARPESRRPRPSAAMTREYWIQADSLTHDLCPTGMDNVMGEHLDFPHVITALVYRAYTANWGSTLPGDSSLGPNPGFPGPVIRANVGDTIVVHFRNNDSYYQQPHSIHPHGVMYTPANDGTWVITAFQEGGRVPYGSTFTYTWTVPPSSLGTWPYHDHSQPFTLPGATSPPGMSTGDDDASTMEIGAMLGLMGHIVITKPTDAAPDQEFFLVMHDLYAASVPQLTDDVDCFNGLAYLGNTPTFAAKVGQHVRWHVITIGSEFHVFHIHGHRWKTPWKTYTDSVMLGPSTSTVIDYVEDNPGQWLYHCHVTDHMAGGMIGWYDVSP